MFSIVVAPFYIPILCQQCTSLPNSPHNCQSLKKNYTNECEVAYQYGFALYFPNTEKMLGIFSCSCWSFLYLLWRNVYSCLSAIFITRRLLFAFYLLLSCRSSLHVLETNLLSDMEAFFSIPWVAFSLLLVFGPADFDKGAKFNGRKRAFSTGGAGVIQYLGANEKEPQPKMLFRT